MKVTIQSRSGAFDLEVGKEELVRDLLKKAREKHPRPSWANGVQLKLEDKTEDLVETSERRTVQEAGIFQGATLRMAYYKQVTPQQGQELRMSGIYPGNQTTFLMPKEVQTLAVSGIAGM
mmetsp:Transcript_80176/g.126440  ORF Transcript_80176/g.126440 Transcript_80176/m.126440 type:complete len:120 (-) Transcript_80176:217-576(-)